MTPFYEVRLVEDYADRLAILGRARAVYGDSPLPITLAASVAGRVRWLRNVLIPRLDDSFRVAFPFVVVKPQIWTYQLPGESVDGTWHAAPVPLPLADGNIWGIEFSAATLLFFPDDLIEAILCHEFLHYVWYAEQMNAGQEDFDTDALNKTYEHYSSRDARDMADGERWLTPRQRQLCEQFEDANDPTVTKACSAVRAKWEAEGLPIEDRTGLGIHVGGLFLIDRAVVTSRR